MNCLWLVISLYLPLYHTSFPFSCSYAGMLKAQKSNLIAEQDFHKKSDNETKPTMSSNPKVRLTL